jgi:hypothetical protein
MIDISLKQDWHFVLKKSFNLSEYLKFKVKQDNFTTVRNQTYTLYIIKQYNHAYVIKQYNRIYLCNQAMKSFLTCIIKQYNCTVLCNLFRPCFSS